MRCIYESNTYIHMQVILVDRSKENVATSKEGKPLQLPIDAGAFGEKMLLSPILIQAFT